jgi:hypothetical protein
MNFRQTAPEIHASLVCPRLPTAGSNEELAGESKLNVIEF